jgi:hypothetical protein
MKNTFRKLRGKKDNEEGNRREFNDARTQSGLTSALQNMNLSPGSSTAQKQHVGQQPESSGSKTSPGSSPAQKQHVEQHPASFGAKYTPSGSTNAPQTAKASSPSTGRLSGQGSVPFEQLAALLAAPASSTTVEEAKDLCKIPLPPLCAVCCNFDPYRTPPDHDESEGPRSWARTEYNIPESIPVGKISIQKSEDLIESAKRGCFYCSMVFAALGAVSPGWDSEKSFIHIFLAAGLPVCVRLQFGVTSTVALGKEEMLELGIELEEGQIMDFVMTVGDPNKPAIDVEIYRPQVPLDQRTVACMWSFSNSTRAKWQVRNS